MKQQHCEVDGVEIGYGSVEGGSERPCDSHKPVATVHLLSNTGVEEDCKHVQVVGMTGETPPS